MRKNKMFRMKSYEVEGIGVIEVILILVVLIGLVIIFRDNIRTIVNNIFADITQNIPTVN